MRLTLSQGLLEIVGGLVAAVSRLWQSLRETFWVVLGYGFILLWWIHFQLKIKVFPWLPIFFVAISLLDFILLVAEIFEASDSRLHQGHHGRAVSLLDDWIHLVGFKLALSPESLFALAVLSITLAVFIVWHHHRMTERVMQHLSLLSAIRQITSEATRSVVSMPTPTPADAFIDLALQVLVEATTKFRGSTIVGLAVRIVLKAIVKFGVSTIANPGRLRRAATVLEERADADGFDVIRQWPSNHYKLPLRVARASAAGKALEHDDEHPENRAVIYVPWTYFPHGIRLWVDETRSPHYRRMGFANNAFAELETPGEPKPRSLICTESIVEGTSKKRYVLCLDSNWWYCFQEVDFQALDVVASVVGIVLTATTFGTKRP